MFGRPAWVAKGKKQKKYEDQSVIVIKHGIDFLKAKEGWKQWGKALQ